MTQENTKDIKNTLLFFFFLTFVSMFPKRTLPSVSPAASWNNMEERRTSRTWHNSTTETIHHLGSKGHTAGLCFMVMLPDVTPYPPPSPHLSRTFWKCHSEFGDLTAVFKALGSRSTAVLFYYDVSNSWGVDHSWLFWCRGWTVNKHGGQDGLLWHF